MVNLSRIVMALPADSAARATDMEAALLRALVEAGEYSQARALMRAVAPVHAQRFVRDQSFTGNGPYAPFDWSYASGVALAAAPTGATGGGLHYRANTGEGGVVASQLITLAPGSYRLSTVGRGVSPNDDGGAVWSVRCAGAQAKVLAQLRVEGRVANQRTRTDLTFAVPSGCPTQWLDLTVRPTFSPGGVEGIVSKIGIEALPSTG